MKDSELMRYSRQIMLPEIDVAGQEKLNNAKVLILGLGGLGSPVAIYLAAAGVNGLTLADDDTVDISNLQRQIAHTTDSVGINKAISAKASLEKLNPKLETSLVQHRMNRSELLDLVPSVDLVIDSTDNLESRNLINEVCWESKKVLISGAAIRWEGHVSMFDSSISNSPCYRCLYPNDSEGENMNCSENGVVSPLVGVVGTIQAMEAIKFITGVGESLVGKVIYYDAKRSDWQKFNLAKSPDCQTCSS